MTGPSSEESLRRLLAHAESLSAAVRAAHHPVPDVVESGDRSGAVAVTLAGSGRRVTGVRVSADWRERVGAEGLATAVQEAVLTERLRSVRDFFATAAGGPAAAADVPLTGGTAPAGPPPAGSVDPPPALDWTGLEGMLETVHRALDSVVAGQPGPQPAGAGEVVVGRSDNRRVEVSLAGGELTGVTIDEQWAARATRQALAGAILEAFGAGYAAVADAADARAPDAGADLVAQLRSIVSRVGAGRPTAPGGAADATDESGA